MRRYLALALIATGGLALAALVKTAGSNAESSDTQPQEVGTTSSKGIQNSVRVPRAKPELERTKVSTGDGNLSTHQTELAAPALAVLAEIEGHPALADNAEVRRMVELERQKIAESVRGVNQ